MKKALIVGNNYPDTPHPLRGCVNDAVTIKTILQTQFDFDDVEMMLDKAATTAAMLDGLERLVAGTVPGDTVFFHYSGHGSQMVDRDGNEADGLDEIIVPYDLNWNDLVIRDDDLKRIFDKVPTGVNLTVTLDCCNSGGGLDQENVYQPLGEATKKIDNEMEGRFLPPPEHIAMAAESMGVKTRLIQSRDVDQTGIMMSGCQAHQTSADAYINGKWQGAFTYSIAKVLGDNAYKVSHIKMIEDINKFMVAAQYTQRPELDGPGSLFTENFLEPREYENIDLSTTFQVQPLADEVMVETTPDKKNTKPLIIGGVIFLLLVGFALFS